MADQPVIDSTPKTVLAVDCGSVNTTALLIERVKDQYRLAATGQTASTFDLPWQNITLGVSEAIRHIELATGRKLLAPGGWPITPQSSNKQGVDTFIVVSSAGPPLRLALAGAIQEISLASARRAAAATHTTLTTVLSLDAGSENLGDQSPPRHTVEARIQAILAALPDVVLLAGGTDGGAERSVVEMANALAMALRVMKDVVKPHVLFAGNSHIRPKIAEILGPLTTLNSVDNLRPALEVENLAPTQMALESLYIQRKMSRLPGFQKLTNWTNHAVMPANNSFEKVVAYVGRHNGLNVIGVNIGSSATCVSVHTPEHYSSTIRTDGGVGHSLAALIKSVPLQRIRRWLPFDIPSTELHNLLLNKSMHPASIPTSDEDLLVEYAVAREGIRLAVTQARTGWPTQPATGRGEIQWNMLIGAGRILTQTPHPGHAAMILLDAVEPWGVTTLALDVKGVTNILGALAAVHPIAAVEIGARDTFLNLGTVIAPIGHGAPGRPALKIKVTANNSTGPTDTPVEVVIPYGTIEVIELPPGQKATLEIRPARHFDVGLGQPGRGAVTEVEGGALGVIVDVRGRPLRLPGDSADRRAWLRQWLAQLDVTHAASDKNDQR